MSIIFIFIDGIGIGPPGQNNPLSDSKLNSFSLFTGGNGVDQDCSPVYEEEILFKPIDANLGVEGLPQSGTGQTSLFTGINASKEIGKHFGPFPHSKIRPFLKKKSLFHQIKKLNKEPHFLNAYPDIFFEKANKRNRWSTTTLMAKSEGVKLNRYEDVINERAITAEITQQIWREELNLDLPEITPNTAAKRVLEAAKKYDLVLFEYYLTDKAGHSKDLEFVKQILSVLDQFLVGIISEMLKGDTLLITSDHGNLEDISIKTHTRNPVPFFVKGDTEEFKRVTSITDITPAIIRFLSKK